MDADAVKKVMSLGKPFRIETISGKVFELPSRVFLAFTPDYKAISIGYLENDEERSAVIPLSKVTAVTSVAA